MRTAISISNPQFEKTETLAKQLGVSRSELYARALAAYVHTYAEEDVTRRLDEVYTSEDSRSNPLLSQLQWLSLPKKEW